MIPISTHAAIVVNEIAWMGTANSANDEWIELYNNGSTISVDGWVLRDGQNLEIPLAGTIAGGQFAVVERTDDATVPGAALVVYTGALGNDGRTLTLYRADGSIEDQVAGGENWEAIGGDNTTKETAQLTAGGWVTGVPTPGAENVAVSTNAVSTGQSSTDAETVVSKNTATANTKNERISLQLPNTTLSVEILGTDVGYVHEPILLRANATGIGSTLLDSLIYEWNLGDLTTARGNETTVQYEYPGIYIVTVYASYARHETLAEHKITILPNQLSLGISPAGDILVHNDAAYTLNVSGYTLRAGKAIVFPERSYLDTNGTMTIAAKKVAYTPGSMVGLYDNAGALTASLLPPVSKHTVSTSSSVNMTPTIAASGVSAAAPAALIPKISATHIISPVTDVSPPTVSVQSANTLSTQIPPDTLPYLGLMAVITIGIGAVYSTYHNKA